MKNFDRATLIKKAFDMLLDATTIKSTSGDKKAALDLMTQMIVQNSLLKDLGYAISDGGHLVKYKPLTGQRKVQHDLAIRASKGDVLAATHLLKLMSAGIPS